MTDEYRKRIITNLAEEMTSVLEEITNWEDRDDQFLRTKVKPQLAKIFQKYEKMEECDLVTKANLKAIKVKDLAEENVKKAVRQNQNLDELEQETTKFEALAKTFEKNTNDVKKAACWEHWKWKMIIGLACLAVVYFIYVQFFSRTTTLIPVNTGTTVNPTKLFPSRRNQK